MLTIDDYKIRFRYGYDFRGIDLSPVDTFCEIIWGNAMVSEGSAKCSIKDNPNRAVGRKIAFSRALKLLFPEDKEMRKYFWDKYFEYIKK